MTQSTAQVHFRVNNNEKNEFEDVLKNSGISSPTEAFKIFMKQTITHGGLPFEVDQPNERLQKAIKSDDYVKFEDAKEGLDWLND